jgi:hypothetical protein
MAKSGQFSGSAKNANATDVAEMNQRKVLTVRLGLLFGKIAEPVPPVVQYIVLSNEIS